MTEGRRCPGRGLVAGVSGLGRRNVRGRLARGSRAVVTGRTGTWRDTRVAESRGCPGAGLVASVAGSRGRKVGRRFTRGGGAVVAGRTGARGNAGMVHRRRIPR